MKIGVKNVKEKRVAYTFTSGYHNQFSKLLSQVIDYLMKKNLQITGFPYRTYYNSPMEKSPENLQFEVGIPFTGEASGEDLINIRKIPAHQAVSTTHKGHYRQTRNTYHALITYAIKNDYDIIGPVTEIYINDPMKVDESELLREVQFPVTKNK